MKKIRKVITTILAALTLVFAGLPVSAETVHTGAGGDGTITISNATQGKQYSIYKLFDATTDGADGFAYLVPSGKTLEASNAWFEKDNAGNVSAKPTADFSDSAFVAWAESFGTQVGSTVTASEDTLTFDQLTYGYYFVKSSLGAVVTLNTAAKDVSVIDKNDVGPDITVDGGKNLIVNNQKVKTTTAKIGDTINFEITFNATNFVTSGGVTERITKYTIVDTPSDLAINQSSVKVFVGSTELAETARTITFNATGQMTIVIPWVTGTGASATSIYSPGEVKVTYTGILQAGAQDGEASNHAAISYTTTTDTTIPDPDPDPDPKVYTYKFTLNKVDGSSNALTGAKFRLYDAASNGNEIKIVKNADGTYRVAEAGETGVDIDAGTAVVKGLKGLETYHLEETKAPDGYNILTARQAVKLVDANDATKAADATVTVKNNKGTALPSTGSFGTTMFYLAGSVLLVGALVYMISKRRMNNI